MCPCLLALVWWDPWERSEGWDARRLICQDALTFMEVNYLRMKSELWFNEHLRRCLALEKIGYKIDTLTPASNKLDAFRNHFGPNVLKAQCMLLGIERSGLLINGSIFGTFRTSSEKAFNKSPAFFSREAIWLELLKFHFNFKIFH